MCAVAPQIVTDGVAKNTADRYKPDHIPHLKNFLGSQKSGQDNYSGAGNEEADEGGGFECGHEQDNPIAPEAEVLDFGEKIGEDLHRCC